MVKPLEFGDPEEHNLDNVGGDQGKSIDPEKIFAFGLYLSATGSRAAVSRLSESVSIAPES